MWSENDLIMKPIRFLFLRPLLGWYAKITHCGATTLAPLYSRSGIQRSINEMNAEFTSLKNKFQAIKFQYQRRIR